MPQPPARLLPACAPRRELVDTMLESGNTLLSILGNILDFSKVCGEKRGAEDEVPGC